MQNIVFNLNACLEEYTDIYLIGKELNQHTWWIKQETLEKAYLPNLSAGCNINISGLNFEFFFSFVIPKLLRLTYNLLIAVGGAE